MGVAEVGGPVPSAQHGMEEIDSKLRSILWKFICQFMCDKFIFSIFFFFMAGVWVIIKGCILQSLYRFCTLSLDAS